MRECAGARSTQARTPTCSNSDRGPVFLFVFCTWLQGSGASGALEALPGLECSRVLGFRHVGFRVLGFGVWGFRVLGV